MEENEWNSMEEKVYVFTYDFKTIDIFGVVKDVVKKEFFTTNVDEFIKEVKRVKKINNKHPVTSELYRTNLKCFVAELKGIDIEKVISPF